MTDHTEPPDTTRVVTAGFHMSLDGYLARPGGELDWVQFSPDVIDHATRTMRDIDTMVMGRLTFLEQAANWPHRHGDLADAVNAHDKVVATSRPEEVDLTTWPGSRTTPDPVAEIASLRRRPGGRIGVSGGSKLLRSLMQEGVVDELRVITHPVTLGAGLSPWPPGLRLQPVHGHEFDSGAVLRTYRPPGPTSPDPRPERTP